MFGVWHLIHKVRSCTQVPIMTLHTLSGRIRLYGLHFQVFCCSLALCKPVWQLVFGSFCGACRARCSGCCLFVFDLITLCRSFWRSAKSVMGAGVYRFLRCSQSYDLTHPTSIFTARSGTMVSISSFSSPVFARIIPGKLSRLVVGFLSVRVT